MDCRPWPLHGSAHLTSCSVPMHTISHIFPVWRQCISSVTQLLCCIGVTQTTYVVLPIFQKAFSLKAVSPFIAHRAATITIPLSSFFRDVEWQGREVRSFRAQQGQWWVEDATFHFKLAARCPSILACSSSIPFPALFNSLPAMALSFCCEKLNFFGVHPFSSRSSLLAHYDQVPVPYFSGFYWPFFVLSWYVNKNLKNSLPLNVSSNSNWYAWK